MLAFAALNNCYKKSKQFQSSICSIAKRENETTIDFGAFVRGNSFNSAS
jgi:hypothetical protein